MTGIIVTSPPTVELPPGNSGSGPNSLPGVTYQYAVLTIPQTWTALQTYNAGTLTFNGTGAASNVVMQETLNGAVTVRQLSFTDITGTITAALMPALTGDVTSTAGTTVTAIGANKVTRAMQAQGVARSVIGVTGNATANVADIQGTANQVLAVNGAGTALAFGAVNLASSAGATGVLQAASFPALTGDVTTVAGALASTIAANAVTNAKMATMAANTIKVNATGSSAVPTDVDISTLTTKGSPAAGDYLLLSDQAASGALKKVTVSSVGASAGVSSIAGNTGAFTLANGIDNSTNQIQLTAARRTLPTTQTLTSGSGATYTTPANCLWIEVWIVGGGGGGAGTNTTANNFVAGSVGTKSTFNAIDAAPGAGGAVGASNTIGAGGAGGTGGTGSATRRIPGFPGGGASTGSAFAGASGIGGGSAFASGGGAGVTGTTTGTAGATNTGGGGGGAMNNGGSNNNAASAGGGGETAYLLINSPSATYTYTIGGGGAGGSSTTTGGAGGSGVIFVMEHYGT